MPDCEVHFYGYNTGKVEVWMVSPVKFVSSRLVDRLTILIKEKIQNEFHLMKDKHAVQETN